jgi:hypothetical protein
MTAAGREQEWRHVRAALALVAALVAAGLAGWLVYDAVDEDMDYYELTVRCLEQRGVQVERDREDPIALTSDLGAFRTTIETNPVTVVVTSTPERAARVAELYREVGGALPGRLEARHATVYLWDGPASPTQLQTLYDCNYWRGY